MMGCIAGIVSVVITANAAMGIIAYCSIYSLGMEIVRVYCDSPTPSTNSVSSTLPEPANISVGSIS